jgi:hypothetical protein
MIMRSAVTPGILLLSLSGSLMAQRTWPSASAHSHAGQIIVSFHYDVF